MLSLHPPHLKIKKRADLLPSSLIPICSYQLKSDKMGEKHEHLNFTMCNSFKYTIYRGQLCYSLKLDTRRHGESKLGRNNGLILILDPQMVEREANDNPGEDLSDENRYATIFLDTLAPFSDNQEGDYALTDLRWMNGTESFMKLSNEEKDCQIESYEKCQRERVDQKCKCVPWQLKLNNSGNHKVRSLYIYFTCSIVIRHPSIYVDC